MAYRPLPPVEFLRECFDYDPETGVAVWRHRPLHHFSSEKAATRGNAKMTGRRALNSPGPKGYRLGEVMYQGERRSVLAQRVIMMLMTGAEPEMVDHVNGVVDDNRWSNLRPATARENAQNTRGRHRELPKGAYRGRKDNFYSIVRLATGKQIHLGTFRTPAEAHAAYCAYAAPIHGEFFNPGPNRPSVFD